jgi:hypothetical protein
VWNHFEQVEVCGVKKKINVNGVRVNSPYQNQVVHLPWVDTWSRV